MRLAEQEEASPLERTARDLEWRIIERQLGQRKRRHRTLELGSTGLRQP
ncbi:MAG: hypothetical protein MSC30_07370 [Gaiellaceae bacterium MAG52_C11]|nr:hypothetical protein [Candidatus Gaiellasilicea maunaloa]